MSVEPLPVFGTRPVRRSARSRVLAQALARPSLPALVAVVAVVVGFGVRSPELLSTGRLASVLDVAALLGIGGVAVAMLLVAGQFDLSVGVVASASSLMTALLVSQGGWSLWPALLVSLLAAMVVGLVNGVLVVSTGLPSFLVTLATFLVLQGVTLVGVETFTGDTSISGLTQAEDWASVRAVYGITAQIGGGRFRISLLWWLLVTLVASWLLWRTRFGNAVMGSGGAPRPARELGVPVVRTTVLLYLGTAAAGWLIGTLSLVRASGVQVDSSMDVGIEYVVVAVIGGCLLSGGYGSAVGASLGALVYSVAREGIVLGGWDPRWFQAFLGVLLLLALLANGVVRHRLLAIPRS